MLSRDDVLAVAKLSRLELTDAQIAKFSGQLSGVLELFEKIKDTDVSNISETSQVTGLSNVVREDEVEPTEDIDELLKNTPIRDGRNIVVPKIIGDK
jgi:aspartyl-tRNA(Asn)/glutamyl-tRNA(Gln) amidotransferase subunit C